MQIEIWSDVMCPFCYIGKRKLEQALADFPHRDRVELVWKSFQLDPHLKGQPGKDVITHLAEVKGQTRAWSEMAHGQVTRMAKEVGLDYRFDRAVVANSFAAHRFLQFAKTRGLGDAAEEQLFRGYFTEGKDIADYETLTEFGAAIGLDEEEVLEVLNSGEYADAVRRDIEEARHLGIRGVPFFLFNRRYAVSGAQPVEVFRQALAKAFPEWEREQGPVEVGGNDDLACDVDGECY